MSTHHRQTLCSALGRPMSMGTATPLKFTAQEGKMTLFLSCIDLIKCKQSTKKAETGGPAPSEDANGDLMEDVMFGLSDFETVLGKHL